MGPRAAAALVLLLSVCGCAPSSRQECMEAAATKPTDTGVKLAAYECRKRFDSFDYSSAQPAPDTANQFQDLVPKPAEPKPEPAWWAALKAWIMNLSTTERAVFAAVGAAMFAAYVRR